MALVSKLRLGPKIGSGHFGEVYSAEDSVHGKVAVKVMSRIVGEPDCDWDKRRKGLLSEAQNLAKASHPNVVQVHHFVESDDGQSIQFCMALCPKGSLQAAFETSPMITSDVLKVATDVTLGLQALHQRGMLHRDIKPGNLLIGDNGRLMLGDFGLVTDDLVYGYASDQGYLDHLAPEVWLGKGTSVKTDIWALGMTLYRLLHGHIWYSQLIDLHNRIPEGGFASSLPWLPHIPQQWRRLIRRMMHDDTDRRYGTAEGLLAAYANLPVDKEWTCNVANDLISWERSIGNRRHLAQWQTVSPRKHRWEAKNEPLALGNTLSLGGCDVPISRGQCLKELEQFFSN